MGTVFRPVRPYGVAAKLGEMTTLTVQLRSFAPTADIDPAAIVRAARDAEAAGAHRVVVSDHLLFGRNMDAYGRPEMGGQEGGKQPTGPAGAWLEPLTLLSHLAAVTSRVRLGTSILLAALRGPALLAKTVATVDVVSGGRVDLGVGIGWQREEYEASGVDFSSRGRRLDDALAMMRRLWSDVDVSDDVGPYSFNSVTQRPAPVSGGVPLWISGTVQPRAMDRLARFGSGWIPWGADAADPQAALPKMRAEMERRDRDPATVGVSLAAPRIIGADGTMDLAATRGAVQRWPDLGVSDIRVSPTLPTGELDADAVTRLVEALC